MRHGRRFLHRGIAVFLCVSMLSAGVGADTLSEIEEQQEELQQRQEELAEQNEELEEKLDSLRQDEEEQQAYYDTLQEQKSVVMSEIDNANQMLDELDARILEEQANMEETSASMNADIEKLKERLRVLYMTGNASTLEILLNSDSIVDFATKYQFLSAITRHDTELIESVRADLAAMQEDQEQLKADRQAASELRDALEQKQEELTSLEEESAAVLAELQNQEEQINQQLEGNAQESEEMEAEMGRLQLQWQEEMAKATPTPTPTPIPTPTPDTGNDNSEITPTPTPTPDTGGGIQSSGYIWPVPGFPKVGDGWMGGGRTHKGIDIVGAGIYGAPIVAAQSGTVITAYTSDTWGYGWGYHVMIGHSDGYATQYAHMSRVVVTSGQYVEQGEIIGYVGNTGDSYGAHLHFELWSNGERIDPAAVLDYTPSY